MWLETKKIRYNGGWISNNSSPRVQLIYADFKRISLYSFFSVQWIFKYVNNEKQTLAPNENRFYCKGVFPYHLKTSRETKNVFVTTKRMPEKVTVLSNISPEC